MLYGQGRLSGKFTLPVQSILFPVSLGNILKYYFGRAGLYFDRSKYTLPIVNWTL